MYVRKILLIKVNLIPSNLNYRTIILIRLLIVRSLIDKHRTRVPNEYRALYTKPLVPLRALHIK